jgi:hypothetical protein
VIDLAKIFEIREMTNENLFGQLERAFDALSCAEKLQSEMDSFVKKRKENSGASAEEEVRTITVSYVQLFSRICLKT